MIYQILSNLKHNGEQMLTGGFFEGETKEFEHLVTDGVLRSFPGVKTIEDAKKIVISEKEKPEEVEETEPNTWAPTPGAENTWGGKKPEDIPEAPKDGVDAPVEPVVGEVGTGDLPPENGDNL